MSNSRASLASDYLDNFYASLPPRSSTNLIFWILAQFVCTKVVNMSILDLCPNLIHQGYQHVLYFGFLPPGRQTTRLSSCTDPHLANQREEQTHTQGPSLTVILHCLFSFSHSPSFLCLSVIVYTHFPCLALNFGFIHVFGHALCPFDICSNCSSIFSHYNALLDFFSILVTSAVCVSKRKVFIFYFPYDN